MYVFVKVLRRTCSLELGVTGLRVKIPTCALNVLKKGLQFQMGTCLELVEAGVILKIDIVWWSELWASVRLYTRAPEFGFSSRWSWIEAWVYFCIFVCLVVRHNVVCV